VNRAALLFALAACQPPSARRPPAIEQDELLHLAGSWRWLHRAQSDGTLRIEDEQWGLHTTAGAHLAGHYLRTLDVRTTDRVGFPCNQRLAYTQRALFDVVVEADGNGGWIVRETGYQVEPSPCDHGFRHLATYQAVPRGNRLELRWDGGAQTLWHIGDDAGTLALPWYATTPAVPAGAWQWQTRSYDDERHVREEAEWWQITPRGDSALDATYRRRVTVRSVDGSPIACAGAPSWSFDDAYVLDGQREEEHWHFVERAADAATHPCLAATPQRALDEATGEQVGDFLVLEWRGKRRQVLYRAN
jgi:hypothetical protein